MNSATANIHFGDGAVTYENFGTRDEGAGTGNFTYDFAQPRSAPHEYQNVAPA